MRTLTHQLRSWQAREWLFRLAAGAARWAALVVGVVAAACLFDWLADRFAEDFLLAAGRFLQMPRFATRLADLFTGTPLGVRVLLTLAQLALFAAAGYALLFKLNVPSIVALAGRAEEAVPAFDHRLVTALQLNKPTARTEGMSPQLIRQVTEQAEAMSARHRLASLADPSNLKRALVVAAPVLLVAGAFAAWQPALVGALLSRQALIGGDIPRSVTLDNVTPELWPSGDEVELRFAVTGRVPDDAVGSVRVTPEGQPAETFSLTLAKRTDDTHAEFVAKLPPSSVPFTFRARLADGRTRAPGKVRFEPRPVVTEVNAWVLLPVWVDPEGKNRYEQFQPQGEVRALPDSSVRVMFQTSTPIEKATLVLLARDATGLEVVTRRVDMETTPEGTAGRATFDLPLRPTGYRVEVVDANGFANLNPPRRGITLAADEPPRVSLLTETMKGPLDDGPLDDYEVNGMPLALGGQVQIGYAARSPLGVARARILYRVNEGPWTPLPLARVDADPAKVGRFVPELGLFERSAFTAGVEFYPIPAANPETEPPGLEAGGRYNFQTAALTKVTESGAQVRLEVGDRVEFYVEAFDRNPAPLRPGGRSESRIKTVVTQAQLAAWNEQHDQSRERLREIEERQRGVFGLPKRDR